MVGGPSFQPETFHQQLKQWTHFPEKLKNSLEEAKKGTLSIGGKPISVDKEPTSDKVTLFHNIVKKLEDERGLSKKDLRNLFKISNRLQEPGDSSSSSVVKDVAYRLLFPQQQASKTEWAKQFCSEYFRQHQSFEKDQFEVDLTQFFIKNRIISVPTAKEEFAKALALEAPALLFFALPVLEIDNPETKLQLAKLATSNPFSTGLYHLRDAVLSQINIPEWLGCFRVRERGSDNIRGLLGYLVEELGKSEVQPLELANRGFPRHILRFLHFANGVLRYGVVCRKRAERLGISRVSSLDKYPRNSNEVEVNSIHSDKGILAALYHTAKGAITIATERRNDPLIEKVKIEDFGPLGVSESMEDSESLKELSERVHYSLLVICITDKMSFTDNDGRSLPKAEAEWNREKCAISATDGCLEVPVANIDSSSFRAVLMSDRFQPYREFLIIPPGTSENLFCFVPSFEPIKPVHYAYRDESDSARACPVELSIPNFEAAIKQKSEELFQKGQIITHICKGKCPEDLY